MWTPLPPPSPPHRRSNKKNKKIMARWASLDMCIPAWKRRTRNMTQQRLTRHHRASLLHAQTEAQMKTYASMIYCTAQEANGDTRVCAGQAQFLSLAAVQQMLQLMIHVYARVKCILKQACGPAQFGQHTLEVCGLFCCNQSWLVASISRSSDHKVSWLSFASAKSGILVPRFRVGFHHSPREVGSDHIAATLFKHFIYGLELSMSRALCAK